MPRDVVMPVLGMAQERGVLVRWLAAIGDLVEQGRPLMEVETDKAVVEVDAPATGRLGDVILREGEDAAVGTVIARIFLEGETPGSGAAVSVAPAPAAQPGPRGPQHTRPDVPVVPPREGWVRSTPRARTLAAQLGVALADLDGRGSGPGGAVVVEDVREAERVRVAPGRAADADALSVSPPAAPVHTAPAAASASPATAPIVTFEGMADLGLLSVALQRAAHGAPPGTTAVDAVVVITLLALEAELGRGARIEVRRSLPTGERRGVWSGERPVSTWVNAAWAPVDEGRIVDARVHDVAALRLRRIAGIAEARLNVSLGQLTTGTATIDVTADAAEESRAMRVATDIVASVEDPMLAVVRFV